MKKIINLKTCISILLLAFVIISSSAYSQSIFNGGERQPFNSQNNQLLRGPDDAGGGGPGDWEWDDDWMVGGGPIEDVYWLLPVLAIGYGIYSRRRGTRCKVNGAR